MAEDIETLLEDSIDIEAAPERVWSLVTDLPRMSSWSPQVVRTLVLDGPVRMGTRTLNLNRRGPLFWPTRSKVVRFDPHREFAFRVKDNYTVWSFSLEALPGGGTRLVERREAPQGISGISLTLTKAVLGGQDTFTAELRTGIRETLQRIKVEAEA